MKRLPRLVHLGAPLTKKDRLANTYRHWNEMGRTTPITAELLAGMFYTRFRSRMKGLMPLSRVEDDLQHLQHLLTTTKDLAPWCIEAAFYIKGFTNLRTNMFLNEKIMVTFNIRMCAATLRARSGVGEQSEFYTDQKAFGVIRV